MSLTCIHMTFKHKQSRLSTAFRGKMYTEIQGGISFHFVKQWGLTFVHCRAKVLNIKANITNGCDEDGPAVGAFRESAVGAS